MDTQHINEKYQALMARFGIRLQIVAVSDPERPRQELTEEASGLTLCLNPSKFLPDLSYEANAAYHVRAILLPRLVLETKRLILRRFRMEDAEGCFALLSDPYCAYQDCCRAFSVMDEAYIQQIALFVQRESQYAIVLKETNSIIGTVNLFPDASRAVDAMEIGYSIHPAYQRQGYAYEALSALLTLLQKELGLELVTAGTLPDNIPSIRLLQKLGFQPEGIRHKAVWHEGLDRPVDLQYFYSDES